MAWFHFIFKKQNNNLNNTSLCLCTCSKRSERSISKLLREVNNFKYTFFFFLTHKLGVLRKYLF